MVGKPFFRWSRNILDRGRHRARYRQILFSVFKAPLVAFHGCDAFKLVLQKSGKKTDPAEQVYKPIVAGIPIRQALVNGTAHRFHQFRQQAQVTLEKHRSVRFYLAAFNFNDTHGILLKFFARHATIKVTHLAFTVVEHVQRNFVGPGKAPRARQRTRCKKVPSRPPQKLVQCRCQHRAVFKRNQRIALLLAEGETTTTPTTDKLRDHTGPVAVAPRIPGMDNEIFWQFGMGKSPEIFAFHLFHIFSLLLAIQMLQTATATLAIKRALRHHTIGTRFYDTNNAPPRKVLFLESQFNFAQFSRQGSLHKTYPAIWQAGHAVTPLHHLYDTQLYRRQRRV